MIYHDILKKEMYCLMKKGKYFVEQIMVSWPDP